MRAFGGEMFKTIRRPAVWVCVIILLALAVTIGYAIPWLVETHPPQGATSGLPQGTTFADLKVTLYPPNVVRQTLQQWSVLGGVFALIVGVLLQGSEYGWSTVKTLYTQRDGRLAMLGGKLGALAVVVFVLVVGLFAASAVASAGVAIIDGKSIDFPSATDFAKGVGAMYLIFGFWGLFGLTLATLFRQSAMAIGLGLAYALVIEGIIFGLVGSLAPDTVNPVRQWFPVTNTSYLADSFGQAVIRGERIVTQPYAGATHAVLVLLAYVVGFAAISGWLVRRRDVTS
jgi:ABC-type transport system involved in multi-copper enzyme maturation permease subunit